MVQSPRPGSVILPQRPVVVGFGPAGMFAAYELARHGYHPIVLERGQPVRTRHRDILQKFYQHRQFNPESNLLFGEGGAGTYSDGKLYTRVNDPFSQVVLQTLYHHGADPNILIDGKPHVGSDRLPNVCRRMRQSIEEQGGEIRFGARVRALILDDNGTVQGLELDGQQLSTEHVVLAIGHSARDTVRSLMGQGVAVVAKAFQMGVRIEHPQSVVDGWQYGACAGHPRLPAAEYRLVAKGAGGAHGDMFSFCMCPGGIILPTMESPNRVATNGASRAARAGPFANSGLVLTLDPEVFGEDPLAGMAYQEHWEKLAFEAAGANYAVPAQRASDFLANRRSDGTLELSYPLGGAWVDLRGILPSDLMSSLERCLRALDERLASFAGDQAIITGPETRASAPLRVLRDVQSRESTSTPGLFPVGEGAGYAGGIMSAAIDGLKTAHAIINAYAPPR
jgi:uncharacterized FAD-dependent dehydrogenase